MPFAALRQNSKFQYSAERSYGREYIHVAPSRIVETKPGNLHPANIHDGTASSNKFEIRKKEPLLIEEPVGDCKANKKE